jgi:putative ABC transport system substrate-binding protein
MRRREFITLLGGIGTTWPLAAHAQQPTIPVVGFLSSASPELFADRIAAFQEGLSDTGYVEGRNVTIEYRWGGESNDRLPALVADLVRRQVSVIAVIGTSPGALAAKVATTTIPIVFQVGVNPVLAGLVSSLARPGGNLTGVTTLNQELVSKRLELLHQLVPGVVNVALLINPSNHIVTEATTNEVQGAALNLGLQLHILNASTASDLDTAYAKLVELRAGGLVINTDALFTGRSKQLGALSVQYAIPTIYEFHPFAAAGGLMSYGGSMTAPTRQVGVYVGRILKGEKPADLPVQQITNVELIINMKTARALGITVPLSLLGRADEVIE